MPRLNFEQRLFDSLTQDNRQRRQLARDRCLVYQRTPSKGHLKKLTAMLGACGEQVIIEPGLQFDYGHLIHIGSRSYLNLNCTLLDGGQIVIGEDCLIGPNVQLITVNHALNPQHRLRKQNLVQDILIEDNVWIGASAIILPGITVGRGSVIAAGSVVTRDVEAGSLYGGNPARQIRQLEK